MIENRHRWLLGCLLCDYLSSCTTQLLYVLFFFCTTSQLGVPWWSSAVVQWVNNPACLCGGTSLIPSLAWCSGLKILYCHSCGTDCSSGLDSIPGLGTSISYGGGQKQGRGRRRSSLGAPWVKDLALFGKHWPEKFHMQQVWPPTKKKFTIKKKEGEFPRSAAERI